MKYLILVVLYKQKITKSTTYVSLKKVFTQDSELAKNYKIVFWDNSPDNFNISTADEIQSENQLNLDYIPSSDNKPLSHVYNEAIKRYSRLYQYIMIFDQDSIFDIEYFKEFESVISNKSYDVILPIVRFKNKIVSPTKIYFMKGFYYNTAPHGEVEIKTLSAINSGMILSFDFINKHNFLYNEKIRNYCTDDNVMIFLRSNKGRAYILAYEIEHDLSFSTLNANSDSLRQRYNEMVNARQELYSRNMIEMIFTRFYFLVHRTYMSLKYKDIKYLKG